jgi:hypothetical protein
MKTIAALLVVACLGCVARDRTPRTLPELHAMRERASSNRTLSVVGISLGIAAAVVGGVLVHRGIETSSRESSTDDESWIGPALGGLFLVVAGGTLGIGSGITFVKSGAERDAIDQRIRELSR